MPSNIDYASLADRRLGAKMELYDIVTAVTQQGINKQLEALHKVEPALQRLKVTPPENPEEFILRAEMGPPKVALSLGTNNKTVRLFMSLKSGTFRWFHMTHGLKITEIRDWVLVFNVNLNMRQMEDGSIPPNVVQALQNNDVGQAGNYRVNQLLIDFTTARFSSYDDKSMADIPIMVRDDVQLAMEIFLNTLKLSDNGSGTTIAFIPEFTNPSLFHAPSIPPTSMRFQNYPFRSQSDAPNIEGLDQGNNMLLYLEMTNKRALPEQELNFSENWVVPSPNKFFNFSHSAVIPPGPNRVVVPPGADNLLLIDGCVTLSKKIFLDEWLIPKFIGLNWLTDITATYAKYEWEVREVWEYDWSRSCQPDVDYNFVYAGINENHEMVYVFNHNSEKISTGRAGGMCHTKASVANRVTIPLASTNEDCVIRISGTSRAELEVKTAVIHPYYWGDINWNAAFKFRTVANNGGLEIVMDPPIPNEPTVNGGKSSGFFGDGRLSGPDPKDVIKSRMTGYHVSPVLNDMNNLFKGAWQFFFPGAGEFFFKNPVFNREGDLMLELQYKGV